MRFIFILLIVLACACSSCMAAFTITQLQALMDFYKTCDGPNWGTRDGWDTLNATTPCSVVFGLSCDTIDGYDFVVGITLGMNNLVCDSDAIASLKSSLNSITSIQLPMNPGITGTLPTELFGSTKLQTLSLVGTMIRGGTLPNTFSDMQAIKEVTLPSLMITGTLPSISRLSNLAVLNLAMNQLTGPVPGDNICALAGRENATLEMLDLSSNAFNGTFPECFGTVKMSSLRSMRLDGNALTGTVPNSVVANMHPDEVLSFSVASNLLTGSIPDAFSPTQKVVMFSVANNKMTVGGLPKTLCNASVIDIFDASGNALNNATLLPCLPLINGTAGAFNFANMNLAGTVPDSYSALCSRPDFSMDVTSNKIDCPHPSWMVQATCSVFKADKC